MSRLTERALMAVFVAISAGAIMGPAVKKIAETGFAPLFALIQMMP